MPRQTMGTRKLRSSKKLEAKPAPPHFPFLKLPMELQSIILQFVFCDAKIYREDTFYDRQYHRTILSTPYRYPSYERYEWQFSALRLNRQIRPEAYRIYQKHACFVIYITPRKITMLSQPRDSDRNALLTSFEPKILRSIKRVRVEVQIDSVMRRGHPDEDTEDFLGEYYDRVAQLQENVRMVSLKLRKEARPDELQVCWVYDAGLRCKDCKARQFAENCLSCHHKVHFRNQQPDDILQILRPLKYATVHGKVGVYSDEVYHRYDEYGEVATEGPPKKKKSYWADILSLTPEPPEITEQKHNAKLQAWHASEAPKVAYARRIRDEFVTDTQRTMKELKLMLEKNVGEAKNIEDIPKLWMQWEALKAYACSFKTELRVPPSELLWRLWRPLVCVNWENDDFEDARAEVLEDIDDALDRIKEQRRLCFAYDNE